MDDIKHFTKDEKLETHIQAVRIYSQDIDMEFGMKKYATLIMESEKRHKMDKMEIPN